jgi:transposase
MAYREVSRMEYEEVVRRWQAGESQRAIARALGLSRNTVAAYVRAASAEPADGGAARPMPRRQPGPSLEQPGPAVARLGPYQEQIAGWLRDEHLKLTRIQELLGQQGLVVTYTTLRRFVRQAGLTKAPKSTVRMAETAPGEVAEMDFGKLGRLVDPATGKGKTVWALVLVLASSRYSFVWPMFQQTLDETIDGLEAAWAFFGGVTQRLVLDNFPAAVAGTDPLAPRPTRGFLEYSQARGFLVDPARVARPQDKPKVERHIHYVQERFWKGGTFADLADARVQAARWCREVAGQRVHGTTRQVPRVVFEDQERAALLAWDGIPYDMPTWRELVVHPDHHVSFQYALYSAPATTCPPGTRLEVRGDRSLVKLYRRGELVKVHPRQAQGGRSTDPDDYPQERTAYALRAPDRLIRQAEVLGPSVGAFATRLLDGALPWAKLRAGQKLIKLADRYTAARLDAACARALGFDLVDVRRVEKILIRALDREGTPTPPADEPVQMLLPGRFARPGTAFDHRFADATAEAAGAVVASEEARS